METISILVGAYIIYAGVHFFIIQFKKTWKVRSKYEKFLTIFTMAYLVLALFAVAANQ
jgi:hypothetical protein